MAFTANLAELIAEDKSGLLAKHDSWERVSLVEVATILNGAAFDSSMFNSSDGIPLARIRDVVSGRTATFYSGEYENTYLIAQGDLLIGMDGDFNTGYWGTQTALLNQRVCKITPNPIFCDKYFVGYALPAYLATINAHTPSVTVKHLSSKTIGEIELPLPPRSEQTRIVEKLDELLSDLDAGMGELKAARRKLNRYRQSLLKAAVEGTLTADWRAANGEPEETGTELLQRILSERRAGWEKKQLAKLNEQRKAPPKNWRARYAEPVQPDQDKLPTLPENWAWASLDQLLIQLRSGSAETSIREVTPFPILKSSAVRQGSVDFSALNYVTEKQSREENVLALHDLLITRLSGSVEYVGCCVTIDHLPDGAVQYPDRIFCGKMTPGFECLGTYISYWLRSPMARTRIEAAAKSTAGHKRISMSDLQPFPIPLPPLDELDVITRRLENFSAQIATLHESVFSGLLQATAQRKNVLKAAFAGQLVSQDPNEEPASELLARIRAARDSKASGSIAGKRGRKPKVAP